MTCVYTRAQIDAALANVDVVSEVAQGFAAYSLGQVEVPPAGELLFPQNSGELHIKYGAIRGDDVCVVKLATGFYKNPDIGLPPFGGCMLVLSQKTGMVEAVLLEEGELTNHRTAAAGAVAASVLAPAHVSEIGIVGCGVQARLQADLLRRVTGCRKLAIWGRSSDSVALAATDISALGYQVTPVPSLDDLCDRARLIVTTTPAENPVLTAAMIRPGTHITAMGSDSPEKNEIEPLVLDRADVVVADSLAQSERSGEVFQARKRGLLRNKQVVELGSVISDRSKGRGSDNQITVADLTGVAVQDIAIAKAVLSHLTSDCRVSPPQDDDQASGPT
ncbi:MAG: ornithine cyclodeaminase family protein [Boseongicola sp. SB0673_bin_14]|nr:ornithine cyclodeaminase family protein [Boseongicola sp. SB0673_bin_14]